VSGGVLVTLRPEKVVSNSVMMLKVSSVQGSVLGAALAVGWARAPALSLTHHLAAQLAHFEVIFDVGALRCLVFQGLRSLVHDVNVGLRYLGLHL